MKKIVFASGVETERRQDAVYFLIRIAEPDPEYQNPFVTDEASLVDALGASPEEIQARLDHHFGERLPIPLGLPLWQFVDAVRARRPGWPDRD
jgi:hypothetical protein